MLRVRMLLSKDDGQEQVGIFTLVAPGGDVPSSGGVNISCPDQYREMMLEILSEPQIVDGGERMVKAEEDAEAWLRGLPENYDGQMLRAKIIEE
jgi:hypothetical protein